MEKLQKFFGSLWHYVVSIGKQEQFIKHCRLFYDSALLERIQEVRMFEDSKHFGDMPLRYDAGFILSQYEQLHEDSKRDYRALCEFVDANFTAPGTEMMPHIPIDWKPRPVAIERIQNKELRRWAYILHGRWLNLCKHIKPEVYPNQEQFSLLYVPNPFIIPGGRFLEIYYWDSYWILRGLLVSELYETAKGMILNFVYLIQQYGFVPNGNRAYYLNRSQPPFLIPMVYEYYHATKDLPLLLDVLPFLEEELDFWQRSRKIVITLSNGQTADVFHYAVSHSIPRPESFREDHEIATRLTNESIEFFYSNTAAACESGWDFSSRWLSDDTASDLKTIRTSQVVPVDLNAIMTWNLRLLSELYKVVDDTDRMNQYELLHQNGMKQLNDLFWNNDHGVWEDIDLNTGSHTGRFYASNLVPLYISNAWGTDIYDKIIRYVKDSGIMDYPGGIPQSFIESGQQWDAPNGWPPSNHMIILGLLRSGNPDARDLAYEIAARWINTNYRLFILTGHMFEKYNVKHPERLASGGEYKTQEGFGWTNGVVLDLLSIFGDRLFETEPLPVKYSNVDDFTSEDRRAVSAERSLLAFPAASAEPLPDPLINDITLVGVVTSV